MNIKDFVRAMPKVEINLHLEGAFRKETLYKIAEQNEIPSQKKDYQQKVELLENPDFAQFNELMKAVSEWLLYPEDITRLVYDAGVNLAKQEVKYAEICINTSVFMLPGMSFESLTAALNDGRDRVERGWGTQIRWLMAVSRHEPRRADDTMRWAASVGGKRSGVVGFGLIGREDSQPVGQFERAFTTAHKKDVYTFAQAGDVNGAEGITKVIEQLKPHRIVDVRGAANTPELIDMLSSHNTSVTVSMARALSEGWVHDYAEFPLRIIHDENIPLVLSADLPALHNTTLTDQYLAAVEAHDFTFEEIQDIALNAIHFSFMDDTVKKELAETFIAQFKNLRTEDISEEEAG